jgi:DNA repair exonuclease SbcCD ATPase subunit
VITNVVLQNWKAYDRFQLSLDAGTTFLVARNGVGKTSFVEAVLWALLGSAASGIDGDAARRGDNAATVTLQVRLPRTGPVTVTRRFHAEAKRGQPAEEVFFRSGAGQTDGETAWQALLSAEWSAAPALLGRLLVLPEHAVWQELESPAGVSINSAIRDLLRLDALGALANEASAAARRAKRAAQESRAVGARELADAQAAVATAQAEYEAAEAEVATLRAAYTARAVRRQFEADYAQWQMRRAEWKQMQADGHDAVNALLRELSMQQVDRDAATPDDARRQLTLISASLDEVDAELASTRALRELTEGHRRDLDVDDDCPICLRPMDAETVHAAERRHAALLDRLTERLSGLAKERSRLLDARNRLATLLDVLSEPEPKEPVFEESARAADAALAEASDEDLLAAGRAAAHQAEQLRDALGAARSSLLAVQNREREWATAVLAHRRDALATLVQDTARTVADALTSEAADPLQQLVRQQWKKLPLGESLGIDDDGTIFVQHNGRRLHYRCLSGGEKAQVVLLYRVAALKALSAAPVLLLDEPLEHLDPRNRWRFGRMIASLSGSGALAQTLVTTYEEPLARRLVQQAERSEGSPDAAAVAVRYLASE